MSGRLVHSTANRWTPRTSPTGWRARPPLPWSGRPAPPATRSPRLARPARTRTRRDDLTPERGRYGDTSFVATRLTSNQFVGRTAELEELVRASREAADGRPALVLLGGDSGVGKTRLIGELECR